MATSTESKPASSQQSPGFVTAKFREKAEKLALNRWKLETLTGLVGFRLLDGEQKRIDKDLDSESAFTRRNLWERNQPSSDQETEETGGEDMGGNTILGDIQYPTPIVVQQPVPQPSGNGALKMLAGAALGASLVGVPFAGLATYFVSKFLDRPQAVQQPGKPTTDTSLDVGLGKIGDLLKGAAP